jgi:hypothetical protein
LATWDSETTSRYPAFWLDYLGLLIQTERAHPLSVFGGVEELMNLSPQAFAVIVLSEFVETTKTTLPFLIASGTEDPEILLTQPSCPSQLGFP